MNKRRDLSWLIAILGIIAGLLMGLWAGSQWLPRLSGASISDLSAAQQDDYVTLVALGYAQTGDLAQAQAQLQALAAPNLGQLVRGVVERQAAAGDAGPKTQALAQLAVALGIADASVTAYLPSPTLPPSPTSPPPSPTPPPPPPTSTPEPPTSTVAPETNTPAPTDTPAIPVIIANGEVNVRRGPDLNYPSVGSLTAGESALLIGQNAAGDWWQIQREDGSTGWVLGSLVSVEGDASIAPIVQVEAPPPTATRRPAQPAATATRAAPAPPATPRPAVDYVLKSVRLWNVKENGGFFDGPSLHCGEKQVLHAVVNDAAGQPLNGVTALAWNSAEQAEQVTGSKGPGMAEWIMSMFYTVRIVRDGDGSEVTSETSPGLSKKVSDIPNEQLIQAGYCFDAASCQALRDTNACYGHYSWDVTFQRTH